MTCLQVEKCLRGQKRFTVLETRNDGVRFTTSSVRSLSEEYVGLREQYSETQSSLAEEVIEIVGRCEGGVRVTLCWCEGDLVLV